MTQPQAVTYWARDDQLDNAAIKKAGPPTYDGEAYSGVDTGFVLRQDVYDARLHQAEKARAGTPFTTIALGSLRTLDPLSYKGSGASGVQQRVTSSALRRDSPAPWSPSRPTGRAGC